MSNDLSLIKELMMELQQAMQYSGGELNERLGKPEVEVTQIEGELPLEEEGLDFDSENGEFMPKEGLDLKKRLSAIRGK